MTRKGDWIQTFTGRAIYPLDMQAADVAIEDVAHALAFQCRFGGHSLAYYSVAQHSFHVAAMVQTEALNMGVAEQAAAVRGLFGLLDDGSETYLVDVPRPLKKLDVFAGYRQTESEAQKAVIEALAPGMALTPEIYEAVRRADNRMLATEARDLMRPPPQPWNPMPDPYPWRIEKLWSPQDAEQRFLVAYVALLKDAQS